MSTAVSGLPWVRRSRAPPTVGISLPSPHPVHCCHDLWLHPMRPTTANKQPRLAPFCEVEAVTFAMMLLIRIRWMFPSMVVTFYFNDASVRLRFFWWAHFSQRMFIFVYCLKKYSNVVKTRFFPKIVLFYVQTVSNLILFVLWFN